MPYKKSSSSSWNGKQICCNNNEVVPCSIYNVFVGTIKDPDLSYMICICKICKKRVRLPSYEIECRCLKECKCVSSTLTPTIEYRLSSHPYYPSFLYKCLRCGNESWI